MADIEYVVDINLRLKDQDVLRKVGGSGGVDKLDAAWNKLGKSVRDAGGKMADAFTGTVERAGAFAATMGKAALVGGVIAATYGVTKLNGELETTRVSIAAVLNAQGQVGSIDKGLDRAAELVAQMRKDAKELPGEFSDLVQMFQSGVGAAGNAGVAAPAFEKMAAQGMAAAKAMSVPIDQAGRELALLFEGRAGAHNVFGQRLGLRGEGFNQLDPAARVAKIQAALAKFQPAIAAFGNTLEAQSSTFVDNLKQWGGKATMPLFDRVKSTLVSINKWFDDNEGTASQYAHQLGRFLGDAFDTGKRFILDWWPAVSSFAENAYDRIVSIWRDAKPYIDSAAEAVKGFLGDKGSIDKIVHVLELYAAVKAGGAVGGFLGPGVEAASGAGGMAGMLGTALAGVSSIALTVGVVTVAAQVAQWATGTSGKEHDYFQGDGWMSKLGNIFVRKTGYQVDEDRQSQQVVDAFAGVGLESDRVQNALERLQGAGATLTGEMLSAAAAAQSAAGAMASIHAQDASDIASDALRFIGAANMAGLMQQWAAAAAKAGDKAPKAKGGGGGGGSAMKVEITISSNQAPGQIARAVIDEIRNRAKHPRSSVHVRQFAASTRG